MPICTETPHAMRRQHPAREIEAATDMKEGVGGVIINRSPTRKLPVLRTDCAHVAASRRHISETTLRQICLVVLGEAPTNRSSIQQNPTCGLPADAKICERAGRNVDRATVKRGDQDGEEQML